MPFNFGQSFLDQMNRGAARATSNAELQLRAKQVEDAILTNQVQRETQRAQSKLNELVYRTVQLPQAKSRMAADKAKTEASQVTTEEFKKSHERKYSAPDGYELIDPSLKDAKLTLTEQQRMAALINDIRNNKLSAEQARQRISLLKEQLKQNAELNKLAGAAYKAQANLANQSPTGELFQNYGDTDSFGNITPTDRNYNLLQGVLKDKNATQVDKDRAKTLLGHLDTLKQISGASMFPGYAKKQGLINPAWDKAGVDGIIPGAAMLQRQQAMNDMNISSSLFGTPEEKAAIQATLNLGQGLVKYPLAAQSQLGTYTGSTVNLPAANPIVPWMQMDAVMRGGKMNMGLPPTSPNNE